MTTDHLTSEFTKLELHTWLLNVPLFTATCFSYQMMVIHEILMSLSTLINIMHYTLYNPVSKHVLI
jgi:hypothetical protein